MHHKGNIRLEIKDEIGRVILDHPPQNYLPGPEFMPLEDLRSWINQNDLKGVILSGTGRHFSAGARLDNLFSMETGEAMANEMQKGKDLLNFIACLNIPVIAAIQGACFGGGLEIALAAHIRIANSKALFAFPEVNHNLMPGLGGTVRITGMIPSIESLMMILGGDMINAEEALSLRIIDQITNEPEEYAFKLLNKMTENRPLKVIHFVMEAIHNAGRLSETEALKEETRMFCELAREEGIRRKEEVTDR